MIATISSGHSKVVQGANGIINEVSESINVVDTIKKISNSINPNLINIFHETKATNKTDNLNNITKHHNTTTRDLDISIHFNDVSNTQNKDYGIEIIYTSETGKIHAKKLVDKLSNVTGLRNRGAKHDLNDVGKKLGFLRNTNKPAILIEICFVSSQVDVDKYKQNFENLCITIAEYVCEKTYIQSSTSKTYYRVVTNSYNDIENARKEVEELKSKNIDSFIAVYEEE